MSHIQKFFKPLHAVPGIIAGILLYHTSIMGAIATFLALVACIAHAYTSKHDWIYTSIIVITWLAAGYAAAWCEMRPFHALYHNQSPATLTGTITDYNYCSHIRYPHRMTIALATIEHENHALWVEGRIHLYTNHRGSEQPYPLGTVIRVENLKLRKPKEDFARYLIKEGLLGSFFAEHSAITDMGINHINWSTQLHEHRNNLLIQITDQLTPEQAALFGALFVGNKTDYKKEVDRIQTQFRFWGVSHIFARSGMHISLIIGIILYLLFLIPIPYSGKIICATGIGILYALLSWPTISFTRALIMFLWGNYCILARRQTSTLHLLGLTTLLVLLWHPLNLFFLDFQLSFALTGALVWICGQIMAKK